MDIINDLESIVSFIDKYALIINNNQEIIYCNPYLLKFLEYEVHQIIGRELKEILNYSYINEGKNVIVKNKSGIEEVMEICTVKGIYKGEEGSCIFLKRVIESINIGYYTDKIIDLMPLNIWIKDINGKYVYGNNNYSETVQKKRNDIIMATDYDIWPKELADDFIKEDKIVIESKKEFVTENPSKLRNEHFKHKIHKIPMFNEQGEVKYILCIGISGKDIKVFEDSMAEEFIKRKKAEEELEFFFDNSTDYMCILNRAGFCEKVNNRMVEKLGWSKEEFRKRTIMKSVHEDYEAIVNKVVEIIFKNGFYRPFILKQKCKNGEYRIIEWNCRFIKEKNIVICVGRDISDKLELESREKHAEEIIEIDRMKSEFLANISHELRTPLNIIFLSLQSLEKMMGINYENYDEKVISYFRMMKQNTFRLLRMINNLIDITKIDTGFYDLNLENINIVNVVEDIVLSVAKYVEGKGVEIIFDTEIEEKSIAADVDKIERIMLNLLANAVKFSKGNGSIEVYIRENDDKILISVKDDGIGIEEEKLKVIFDRFKQVDNSLIRRSEGSGIGLSLVKSFVEMHGGKIQVTSKYGKGTEFTIELLDNIIEENEKENIMTKNNFNANIQRCNIEFSDIYSLNP